MGVRGLQWCSVVHVISSSVPSEYHKSSNSPGVTKTWSHTQYIVCLLCIEFLDLLNQVLILPAIMINLIQNPWVEWFIIICNVHNHITTYLLHRLILDLH